MKNSFLIIIFCFGIIYSPINGQSYFRISGDYTIKSKNDTASQLVIGKFYYDINENRIIHNNTFPEKAMWITMDTCLYQVVNYQVKSVSTIPNFTIFSMYHLALKNELSNFGLENSVYHLEKVDKEGDMAISTWMPQSGLKEQLGKVLLSKKEGNLFGIIFYNPDEKLLKKQFFEDYQYSKGVAFPGKIVEITYKNNKEYYQVTTYKNIVVNDFNEDHIYKLNPATL